MWDQAQLPLALPEKREDPAKPTAKVKPPRVEVVRLKVSLKNIRPAIWRRLEVQASLSFASLHDILQVAFGWTDSHLHQFLAGPLTIGMIDDEFVEDSIGNFDEKQTRLDHILRMYDRLVYEYDFGDDWEHLIVVEALAPREDGVTYPRCIGGKRSGPPEDCGGPWGYGEFLAAIHDDGHERHDEMMEWIEPDFDPERFSVKVVNADLMALRKRKRWK